MENINIPSVSRLIAMEKWWTDKTTPDVIRGTFNLELLMSVIRVKINNQNINTKKVNPDEKQI
jgi:hypothetical protein